MNTDVNWCFNLHKFSVGEDTFNLQHVKVHVVLHENIRSVGPLHIQLFFFYETNLLYVYSIGLKIAVENADVYIHVPEGNVKKFPLPMKHLSFRRN